MTENQTAKRRRRVNGEGSVYKRGDGYWVGAFDVPTASGARKRVVVYGKTLGEAREKMAKVQQDVRSGIPVPDKVWKLGPYLDYWLENFVKRNRRPATYNLYEMIVRIYLKPGLGGRLNRATSSGPSGASATTTRSGSSRSTTSGTLSAHYSRTWAFPPATGRRPSATPGSAPRWRSTPTPTSKPAAMRSPGYRACSVTPRTRAVATNLATNGLSVIFEPKV